MQIFYSTVIDESPLFYYQGWLLINSLIQNNNVLPEYIIVNTTDGVQDAWIKKVSALGVHINSIERFGDGKYCNKLRQLENPILDTADCLVMMDADMIVLENINQLANQQFVRGKIVDLPNPNLDTLKEIFDDAQLSYPEYIATDIVPDEYTFQNNFNGGLYIIPKKYLATLRESWMKWAIWLLDNIEPLKRVNKTAHVDQITFSMAMKEHEIPYENITNEFNFPTHLKIQKSIYPKILHFHKMLTEQGLLKKVGEFNDDYSSAIDDANTFVQKVVDDEIKRYWRSYLEKIST